MGDQISASEAVFGFASWLVTRKEIVNLNSAEDAESVFVELITKFCKANNLMSPRKNFLSHLTFPKG
jgi:hypothetical protein